MVDPFSRDRYAAEQLLSEQILGVELYRNAVFDAVTRPLGRLGVRNIDDEAAFLVDQHQAYVYLRYRVDLEEELLARVETLCTSHSPAVQIAILGGPKALGPKLAAIDKQRTNGSVIVHWSSDGDVWLSRKAAKSKIARRIERVAKSGALRVDEELFWQRVQEGRSHFQASQAELEGFMRRFRRQKPHATYGLIAATGIVFALQLLWGGAESPPVAWRMGSMVAEEVRVGEYWRLLSYAWLHAGWLHFLINMWVLALLGGLIERLIGPVRLLILYVAGALGGGLAVLWVSGAQTVGASGAIWAMLAASFVLSIRSEGLIPRTVMLGLRKAAVINLGLNLAISFLPQVSMAGHLGGGVAAVVLLGSGALTSGLRGDAKRRGTPRSNPILILALAVSMAIYVAAPILAIRNGKPWQLNSPPEYVLTQIGDTGLSVELPKTLTGPHETIESPEAVSYVFGDLMRTPALVELRIETAQAVSPSAQLATLQELDAQPEALPEGYISLAEPRLERIGKRLALTRSYTEPSRTWILRSADFFEGTRRFSLESMHRSEFSDGYRDLLERVVATLQ